MLRRDRILADVEKEVAKNVDVLNISNLITIGSIYFHEQNYESVLRVLQQADSLECSALILQAYLKLDRVDLAKYVL